MRARDFSSKRTRSRYEPIKAPGALQRQVRTLIVDDSPLIVRGLQSFFRRQAGFKLVGLAGTGLEAVERVAELRPDLVVMDIRMPEMDGLEATQRIKREPNAPVVILFTLEDSVAARAAAKAVGADDFVAKAPEMDVALRSAISRASQKLELREILNHGK
jgi:CheY-like chemotaxis protein